jgi:hypothetical protein
MNENSQNQNYDSSGMQNESHDLNNILAQMPTPVSNNIRASETNSFMSPLEVGQQGYDNRMNGVQYGHSQGNDEVHQFFKQFTDCEDVFHSSHLSSGYTNGHASSS